MIMSARIDANKVVSMPAAVVSSPSLKFLDDRWNPAVADTLDQPELLRYRSNLLGSDLRITNFAGGNTSSKVMETDPLTGESVEVLFATMPERAKIEITLG